MKKQFWAVVFFGLLSIAPFLTVAFSFHELRNAVLYDSEFTWQEGTEIKIPLTNFKAGTYELRMEAAESTWNPTVKYSWGITNTEAPVQNEVAIMRPLAKITIQDQAADGNDLKVQLLNSNPEPKKAVRMKLAYDREAILAKSSQQFLIVLAVSLVLSLFLWRPLMAPVKPNS